MPNLGLSSRAIIGRFFQRLEGAFDKSWAGKIGMKFESDQESETYRWLGMAPPMREWVGERLAYALRSSGITIINKTFENTLTVAVDDKRRDKTGQIMIRVDELADRAAEHWEKLLSTLIINGTAATSGLAYDGQYFFDIDHNEGSSGDQLNLLAAAQVASLDVGTAAAPTQIEMSQAILNTIAYMLGFVDDQAEPVNGNAREFMIMCPVNLWGAALAAATTARLAGASGTVTDNPLLSSGFNLIPVCNPRLTTTTVFYVFRTDGTTKPFILQEELPLTVQAIAEGSEEEFKNDRHLYGIKAVRNVGYGQWQHAAHCTLS